MELVLLLFVVVAYVALIKKGVMPMPFAMQVIPSEPTNSEEAEKIDDSVLFQTEPAPAATTGAEPAPAAATTQTGDGVTAAGEPGKSEPEPAKANTPAAAEPSKVTPPAKPAEGTEPALLAGRFKGEDELVKGVINAAKAKGIDALKIMQVIGAKKNIGEIEALYKELDAAITEKRDANVPELTAAPAAPAKPAEGETGAGEQLSAEEKKQLNDAITIQAVSDTVKALRGDDIVAILAANGYDLPADFLMDKKATEEFMAKLLKDGYGVEYKMLKDAIEKYFNQSKGTVLKYVQTQRESVGHNATVQGAEIKKIQELVTASGIKKELEDAGVLTTDEALKAFAEATLKAKPWLMEERMGVPYLRAETLVNEWRNANFEKITKAIALKEQLAGRTQAAADLAKLSKEGPQVPSTAGVGVGKNHVPFDEKTAKAEDFEHLSDEELTK